MLTGREEQLQEINSHIEHRIGKSDGPNVLFVTGEAGIGKTTLLDTVCREWGRWSKSITIVSAACSTPLAGQDIGEVEALGPWAEIMTHLAAGEQDKKLETRKLVGELALAWMRVIPVVGDVLESVVDTAQIVRSHQNHSTRETAPPVNAANQQQVFQQYVNVLAKLSERTPLVLILDDVHWADTSSVNLLFTAARQLADRPILFVIAYRPDDAASSRGGEGHPIVHIRNELERYSLAVEVGVPRMTALDLDSLLRQRYPNYRNNDAFEEWLARVSAGNALFVTRFLDTLEDDGYIDSTAGVIGEGYEHATVPQSAYAVVSERLRRLSEETRELLRYASVEGDTFTTAVLAKITEMPQLKLLQRLRLAEQVHHVVRSLGKQRVYTSETTAYQFSHALLQMAMYDSLEQEERELLHQAIFEVLKDDWQNAIASAAGNVPSIAARLAVHAGVLGEHLFAATVLLEGARSSWRDYAEQETMRQLEAAITALDNAGGNHRDAARLRAEAVMKRGEVHSLRGRYDAALADFQHAHELFNAGDEKGRMVEAMNYEAVILGRQGKIVDSETHAEAALSEASAAGDARGEALALRTLGVLQYQGGNYERSLGYYQQSLALEQSLSNRQGEADLLSNIGNVHYQCRRYEDALGQYRRSLELYESVGDNRGVAKILNNIGLLLDLNNEQEEALMNLRRSLETYRSIGDRTNEAQVLNNMGNLLNRTGKQDEAMEHFRQSVEIFRKIGERSGEAMALYNIGNVQRLTGHYSDALATMQQGRELFRSVGNRKGEATATVDIGLLLLTTHQPSDALAELGKGLEIAQDGGFMQLEAQALLLLGQCHVALEKWDEGRESLQQAMALAGRYDLKEVERQAQEELSLMKETTSNNDH